MREIKFRGMHFEPGGNWLYGNLVVCKNGDCLIGTCKEYSPKARYMRNQVYADSVGQYTGMHDMYGKEIYEGDVIYIEAEEANYLVRWDESGAGYVFDGIENALITSFDNWYEGDVQVIGNEFENPELL